MSTSDSDYSIDWLASDEDDCDSPKRLSPELTEEPPSLSSSSSSSSLAAAASCRESPTSCFVSGAQRSDCKDGGCCDSAVTLVQRCTSICLPQTLTVEAELQSTRKRTHDDGSDARTDTENTLFSHKCSELQVYVQPLSSILRGLRSGRYSDRLSSFQESVAMDRIQRIMGVLQNPNMGGCFLSIILKIEEMLQSWFPHIKPNQTQTDDSTPAKKQRQHHSSASSPPPRPPAASHSCTHLKWLHMSPICSLKTPEATLGQPTAATTSHLDATQDNAVSSSTDTGPLQTPNHHRHPPRLYRGPPPFKITSPCLERLLQAKESIIAPRTAGDGGVPS